MTAAEPLLEGLNLHARAAGLGTDSKALARAYLLAMDAAGQDRERLALAVETAKMAADLGLGETAIVGELLAVRGDLLPGEKKELEPKTGKEAFDFALSLARIHRILQEGNPEKTEKTLASMAHDFRLLLLTLAEQKLRLEKGSAPPAEKRAQASDILEIYAPLAEKLGVNTLKSELEDLAFKTLHPEEWQKLEGRLRQTQKAREKELHAAVERLAVVLAKQGIPARMDWRFKYVYSTHKKMKRKGMPLEKIYDLNAVRVITKTVEQCYEVLGIVHSLWQPIPEEFDDYIAKPKSNYYQSLHTAVVGENGLPFEVQIRTEEMHAFAEYGVASHWRYKGTKEARGYDAKLELIRQVLQWAAKSGEGTAARGLKVQAFENCINVFTPKGQAIELPAGATALDFAYAIHSELGNKAHKIKVNGKLVSLEHELSPGDTVEVIISAKQAPKRSWLTIVKTEKARKRIWQFLHLRQHAAAASTPKPMKGQRLTVQHAQKNVRFARCCNPLPGMPVIGYRTTKRKVIVHSATCPETGHGKNAGQLITVDWGKATGGRFLAELKVLSLDKPGMLSTLLNTLSKQNVPVKAVNAKASPRGTTLTVLAFELANLGQLEKLAAALEKVPGVQRVTRTGA